jgi:hypothetical protein
MTMNTITSSIKTTIRKFAAHKALDKIAFIIVLCSFAAMGYLLATVAVQSPLFGSITLTAYVLFTRSVINFVLQQLNQPPSEQPTQSLTAD